MVHQVQMENLVKAPRCCHDDPTRAIALYTMPLSFVLHMLPWHGPTFPSLVGIFKVIIRNLSLLHPVEHLVAYTYRINVLETVIYSVNLME